MALTFDDVDNADIAAAIADGGTIWKNPKLLRLKAKIKDSFIFDESSQCCYCARSFKGEFRMVIDVEHILPQSIFSTERFVVTNLNVACKRCNMDIKKHDTSFIVSVQAMGADYYQTNHYKIVHPNLDNYTDHLVVKTIRMGNLALSKYVIKNPNKAKYTYDYFNLKGLEIDTVNKAQGIDSGKSLSQNISLEIKRKLIKLLIRI